LNSYDKLQDGIKPGKSVEELPFKHMQVTSRPLFEQFRLGHWSFLFWTRGLATVGLREVSMQPLVHANAMGSGKWPWSS
jgi:hypothetical protein